MIIIAARPSMGKTALGLNIAINTIKNSRLPVLFLSLEMSKEQLIYRLLASEAEINHLRLRSGDISKEDWFVDFFYVITAFVFYKIITRNLELEKGKFSLFGIAIQHTSQ